MRALILTKIIIGTRQSALALWQTHHIEALLKASYPSIAIDIKPFSTRGDEILDKALPEIGGKGVFTEALEMALRDGQIDYAVHSLKDVPTGDSSGLMLGAITQRATPQDVLISKGGRSLDQLPSGATIGTSSRRRSAQLLAYRPDLNMLDIRGNVGTRIEKALSATSPYDAIILAQAGIDRLGLSHYIAQVLPIDLMLPAPGQGALAVQCRVGDTLLTPIADEQTTICVTAERAFLSALGGGCSLPVGAYGQIDDNMLHLRGRVCALGEHPHHMIDVVGKIVATRTNAHALALELAQTAIAQGAKNILAGL